MSKTAKEQNKRQEKAMEQVKNRAMKTLNMLVSQFYEVFMENDPDDQAVSIKRTQVVAKWKMYCHQNALLEAAFSLCDENCQKIVDKYNEQLNTTEKPVEA